MNIDWVKGQLFDGDKLIRIETKDKEAISIYKLLILINQFALNESRRYKDFLPSLFFEDAVSDMIKWGKEGVDFLEEDNYHYLKDLSNRVYPTKKDYLINKFKQAKLSTFSDFKVKDEITNK